jgi:hypothetical protein
MFSLASTIDEWPEFTQRLGQGHFSIKKNVKLSMQINHTERLKSFIEAILLPIEREQDHDSVSVLKTTLE